MLEERKLRRAIEVECDVPLVDEEYLLYSRDDDPQHFNFDR